MNLLDIIAATEAKEKAIAQVATSTDPKWFAECYRIVVATATNTYRPSQRVACHARPIRVWTKQ